MNILETDRLLLRLFTVADAPFVLDLLNQPSFIENIGDRGIRDLPAAVKYTEERIIESYQRLGFGMYAVVHREKEEVIGMCGLVKRNSLPDIDIGFAFLPQHWSQGFALESAAAVTRYAFDSLGVKRLLGITNSNNRGSINVLLRIGLDFEGMITLPGETDEIRLYGMKNTALSVEVNT